MSRYIAEMMSRKYKSLYGKGIRSTYTVLQIKADSPVNGANVFWYEGNCSILGSKNVYIGYNDNSMSVLSQFELVMTLISGAFLLFHAVSARLLSKKNPYGGGFAPGFLNNEELCDRKSGNTRTSSYFDRIDICGY